MNAPDRHPQNVPIQIVLLWECITKERLVYVRVAVYISTSTLCNKSGWETTWSPPTVHLQVALFRLLMLFFFAATHRLSRRDKFRSSFSWMNFFSRENFVLCKRTISEGKRGKTFSQRCACCTENAFETKQWENCWAGKDSVLMVFRVLCWWKISS